MPQVEKPAPRLCPQLLYAGAARFRPALSCGYLRFLCPKPCYNPIDRSLPPYASSLSPRSIRPEVRERLTVVFPGAVQIEWRPVPLLRNPLFPHSHTCNLGLPRNPGSSSFVLRGCILRQASHSSPFRILDTREQAGCPVQPGFYSPINHSSFYSSFNPVPYHRSRKLR